MHTVIETPESFHVLMIGNNPIELGKILDRLSEVKSVKIITEFAFDLKSSLECLSNFQPTFIIIDDNIGKVELSHSIKSFLREKKTKNIPITIIKNSNYEEVFSKGPLNFVLKSNLTGELLYKALTNSIRYRKTQDYLKQVYRKRKGQLKQLIKTVF